MAAADISAALKERFPAAAPRASADHPAFNVPAAEAAGVLQWLRDEQGFDFLMDLTAIDWAEGATPRFTIVYHLYSSTDHRYIRIAAHCPSDEEPAMPTVTGLWPGANWHEREVFDMFGIKFEGHPDLRRILMWDGYPYFPLRKEFPLAGIETVLPDAEVTQETHAPVIAAPMMGGPFVASSGQMNLSDAEPQAKDESWTERRPKPEEPAI
ncbi:MAG TPA: NADH-quinone oxidoreductase subunit C [Opitutaceae bacterium]|jgi:NADH-quinone oxidoreductase subunit C|nr:NADH-quinone oxidoreductase subunit C [Opitutaceae bacterium]